MEPNQPTSPLPSAPQPIQAASSVSTPAWLIILLLLFFWPLAYYLMYKDKRYHSWFPILLWIYMLPLLLVALVFGFLVYPQLDTLYSSLGVSHFNINLTHILLYFFIIILIIEGIYTFIVWKKIRKQTAPKALMLSLVILLVFTWIFSGSILSYTMYSAISATQDVISQVGSDTLTPSPVLSSLSPTPTIVANCPQIVPISITPKPTSTFMPVVLPSGPPGEKYNSTWLTYQDIQRGISFSYPPSWKLITTDNPVLYPLGSQPNAPGPTIAIYYRGCEQNISQWTTSYMVVDGIESEVSVPTEAGIPNTGMDIYVPFKNETIDFSADIVLYQQLLEILKTVKFQ